MIATVTAEVKAKTRLTTIIFIYLLFATAYSIVVPIGRGADEWAHYHYARFITAHGRLPLSVAERQVADYKSDWPPLYHLMAAGLTSWIETDGPPTFKYRADNYRYQLVAAQGPEAILHTQDEQFPWRQEVLVWHVGRFLSIALGALTLLLTYCIAEAIFQRLPMKRPLACRLALMVVMLLAFNPRFLFTSMLFSYDSLNLLLATLFLWQLLRVASDQGLRGGYFVLGGLAGLTLMTKYLAALLPLEILAVALLTGRTKRAMLRNVVKLGESCPPSVPPEGGEGSSPSHWEGDWRKGGRAGCLNLIPLTMLRRLPQAMLAYCLVITPWFSYLVVTFNEIDEYGPLLGTLAPLIRGDGSDRTVEELFAWLSDGQTPPARHIEKASYPAWQIMAELPLTFWGNPIVRPYPLNWFVISMTIVTFLSVFGLASCWLQTLPRPSLPPSVEPAETDGVSHQVSRRLSLPKSVSTGSTDETPYFFVLLLLLHSSLPVPFMLMRLFGARDALEAVQGRHLLFLSGPALLILLVMGLWLMVRNRAWSVITIASYALAALLLTAALSQLIFMAQIYPPLLPVQTLPLSVDF